MSNVIGVYAQKGGKTIYSRALRGNISSKGRIFAGFSAFPLAILVAFYVFFQGLPNGIVDKGLAYADEENTFLGRSERADFLEAYDILNASAEPVTLDMDSQLVQEADSYYLEQRLNTMVGNTPIHDMVPFIAQQDRIVAALLVGIAKKESSWGQHAPSKDGVDCFNYWGYKGNGSRGSSLGYACFGTPEEAINTVGKRIYELAVKSKRNTPAKMVVWKCGNSCEGHSFESVASWIRDVDTYFSQVLVAQR